MKRKQLIAVSILGICLFASACGSNTTDTETIAVVQNTETQQAEIETENISTELVEESLSEPTEQIEVTEPTTDTSTSKWADINGAWDAVHQFTLYAREQGADDTDGWCWGYYNGKGAGDQPSYAVYMKEGDPLYGTVYHVGDYLPDGSQFCGTNDEWEAFIAEDMIRQAQEEGLEVTEEDGAYVIHLD